MNFTVLSMIIRLIMAQRYIFQMNLPNKPPKKVSSQVQDFSFSSLYIEKEK